MISFSNKCSDNGQLYLISTCETNKKTQVECHEAYNKDVLVSMLSARDKGKNQFPQRESILACDQLFLLSSCATQRGSRYLTSLQTKRAGEENEVTPPPSYTNTEHVILLAF